MFKDRWQYMFCGLNVLVKELKSKAVVILLHEYWVAFAVSVRNAPAYGRDLYPSKQYMVLGPPECTLEFVPQLVRPFLQGSWSWSNWHSLPCYFCWHRPHFCCQCDVAIYLCTTFLQVILANVTILLVIVDAWRDSTSVTEKFFTHYHICGNERHFLQMLAATGESAHVSGWCFSVQYFF